MRLSSDELNKVKDKYGVKDLWSYSKFDCYRTSQWEWKLKYLDHVKENCEIPSAYAPLGTAVHDLLENMYDGKITYEDMANEFDDIWTTNIEIADLKFDRSSTDKNNNLKTKYYDNLTLFFKNYIKLPYKMCNEKFLAIKISDDIVFQGYCDAMYKNEDDVITIVDYKTSSKYTAQGLIDHSAQLILYSEALRQMGIPKDKIRCCFNFLKYVNINCEQMNGKIKVRSVERRDIGEKLQSSVKAWLKKLKYSEDKIFTYLDLLIRTNDIECLPEDCRSKYSIEDCYVYIDNIWDEYDKLQMEIIETIKEIRDKADKYKKLKDENKFEEADKLFWDSEESVKAQSYYFSNLCGYNIPTLKPFSQYLNKMNADKNEDDLLNIEKKNSDNDEYGEDDLSWLNDL